MLRVYSLLTTVTLLAGLTLAQSNPLEVTFPSGKLQLHGFLYKPDGPGPFPAVLWNHGSEKLPGQEPELAKFYTSHFFIFFVPHRRGQGRSPGDYIQDQVMQTPLLKRGEKMMELQEAEVEDVVAAVNFLKAQPFVDARRIAISGCSYGGIQTLLTGERDLGVKALVPFAPAAMSWQLSSSVRERLNRAVDNAKAPIFLLQAQNDYSIEPSRALSKEAEKKHKDFQSKIYPAFGSKPQDGHWGFCTTAMNIWGPDVLSFLAAKMRR